MQPMKIEAGHLQDHQGGNMEDQGAIQGSLAIVQDQGNLMKEEGVIHVISLVIWQ